MIRLLALLLLTVPVHAGVIFKETPVKNKRWVYEDGLIEVFLTDNQTEGCMGRRYLYVISGGSHKIEGCWEEIESLVHIKYDNGYKFVVKADKFVERKISESPVIKTKDYRD
jgi:hypothetical protein